MYKFMGLNMKPGKEYHRTIGKPFHISGIAIGEGKTAKLYVTNGKKTFLAAKVSKAIPQVPLDLKFSGDDKIMFEIKGDARVSLVGYWLNIDFNKSDERIDMSIVKVEDEEDNKEWKMECGVPWPIGYDDNYWKWKEEDGELPFDEYKSPVKVELSDSELDPLCDVISISDSDDEEEVAQPKASLSDVITLSDSDDEEEVAQPKAKIAKLSAEAKKEQPKANDQTPGQQPKAKSYKYSLSDVFSLLFCESDDKKEVAQPKAKVAKLSPEIILKKSAKEHNDADKKNNSDSDSESELIYLPDSVDEEEVAQPKDKVAELIAEIIPSKSAMEQNDADKKDNSDLGTNPEAKKEQPMAKSQPSEQQPISKDQTFEQQPKVAHQTSEQQQPDDGERILTGGVKISDVIIGDGDEAKPGKNVVIYYVGHLRPTRDVFNSVHKKTFLHFALGENKVIKGLSVGVAGMKVGGKRLITCPSDMAFGERGFPPYIPPNSIMHFEVELTAVQPD